MGPTLRKLLNAALVLACSLLTSNTVIAQLETTDSDDAEELVTSLIGEGIIITDIEMDCPNGAAERAIISAKPSEISNLEAKLKAVRALTGPTEGKP